MRANGYIEDHESRAALEDSDAEEYLQLQVSEDEGDMADEFLSFEDGPESFGES